MVTYGIIVDLNVTDPNLDGLVELLADLVVNLLDSPRNDASLSEVVAEAEHREGLTSTRLTVCHDSAVVASDYVGDDLSRCEVIDVILSGILEDVVEFEFPVIQLVVDESLVSFVDSNIKVLIHVNKGATYTSGGIDVKIVRSELISRSGSDEDLHGLFGRHRL